METLNQTSNSCYVKDRIFETPRGRNDGPLDVAADMADNDIFGGNEEEEEEEEETTKKPRKVTRKRG